jgi:O-antigen ligase
MTLRRLEPLFAAILAVAVALGTVQLAYRVSPIAPLVAGGALGAVTLALARPMWVLYLSIAAIPLELLAVKVGSIGLSPGEGLFLLTGLAWAARRVVEGHAPWTPSPLGKPYALLLLSAFPALATVGQPFLVWKVIVLWTSFFFVFEMIVTEADDNSVRNLLFVLALSGAVVGAIAIGGAGSGPQLIGAGDTASGRATGSFTHPNTLATFLALAMPGALALGLYGRRAVWRPVALVAFVAMLVALSLSLSRGGLLAVAGALAVMLIWAPFRRATVVAAVLVAVLYAAGVQPLGQSRQVQTLTMRLQSVGYSSQGVDPRFGIWQKVPRIATDALPFGVGANNFPQIAARYGVLDSTSTPYDHAHNIVLTFLVELGLAGLAALIWATVALANILVRAYRRANQERRGLVLAVGAALVALALQGMVDYTLRSAVIVALIFTLAGCAVVLGRDPDASAELADGGQPRASDA